jgi:hypothetical protein
MINNIDNLNIGNVGGGSGSSFDELNLCGINGLIPKHNNSTSIKITPGVVAANGKLYTTTSDTTHTLTSLSSSYSVEYILIDDDVSSAPTPTFINSSTSPSYDVTRRGWYLNNDRCIGVISNFGSPNYIQYFETIVTSDTSIKNVTGQYILATSLDANNTWQTPNISNTDTYTPLNTTEVFIFLHAHRDNAIVACSWASEEYASFWDTTGFNKQYTPHARRSYDSDYRSIWGSLGSSRRIKVWGADELRNDFHTWAYGYRYLR